MACRLAPRDVMVRPRGPARKAARMIAGIGMDLVNIPRFAELMERRGPAALRRFFTEAEVERCRQSKSAPESFAARFAAKEAFFKALGTGWGLGGRWTEVEVVSAPSGAPGIQLTGRAAEAAAERGVRGIHLSLTHTEDTAGAFVVLEG
ncbi:holo-ACP synthase [Longimicrobium sp.]|uniref:holo-ACP synthase n=1 Tax=Longimicrobium sp. TaxID=2029185 RepID=UPI002E2F6034|nr:holo-ACP synthase [Longimicrobium sp.]HEX6040731.1 holo-ACP synthase [Longimicrobium sp.]